MVIPDRAVAVRPIHLLQLAIPHYGNQLVGVPGGLALRHHGFDLRPNDRPDLGPAIDPALSYRGRVFIGTNAGTVTVVVELYEFRPPPEKHGVPRGEHKIDTGHQRI